MVSRFRLCTTVSRGRALAAHCQSISSLKLAKGMRVWNTSLARVVLPPCESLSKKRTPWQSLTTSTARGKSSPFDLRTVESTGTGQRRRTRGRKTFIPIKAAVQMTDRARDFFAQLLASPPRDNIVGIRLNYEQSRTGEPRMVFSFEFVAREDLHPDDEPVSLELLTVVSKVDGSTRSVPKTPRESWNDGLPKLYVSTNAFFKVLGATVDVDSKSLTPILYDKEGNLVDPSA